MEVGSAISPSLGQEAILHGSQVRLDKSVHIFPPFACCKLYLGAADVEERTPNAYIKAVQLIIADLVALNAMSSVLDDDEQARRLPSARSTAFDSKWEQGSVVGEAVAPSRKDAANA
jgi:hypothetical protein